MTKPSAVEEVDMHTWKASSLKSQQVTFASIARRHAEELDRLRAEQNAVLLRDKCPNWPNGHQWWCPKCGTEARILSAPMSAPAAPSTNADGQEPQPTDPGKVNVVRSPQATTTPAPSAPAPCSWRPVTIERIHPDCEDGCQILEHKGYHTCAQTGRCEYAKAGTAPSGLTREQTVRQAVARGWCDPANSYKNMDAILAESIVREICALDAPDGSCRP